MSQLKIMPIVSCSIPFPGLAVAIHSLAGIKCKFYNLQVYTSQNNRPLHHAVGSPMNLHDMGFLSPLTLMQHYRLRNN